MCIRIIFLCPFCRSPSGQTTTILTHGRGCWDRVLVERLMATQHFYPGWSCTTPDCGYSRNSQERDAEEMRKLQADQAWNATGSDADDEMCGDESDAIIENSDSDMETEPANFRATRSPSVKREPRSVDWSVVVSSSESLTSDGETGSESGAASAKSDRPIKTERTPSTSPPLVRQHLHQDTREKVGAQAGAVATRCHWLGYNSNKNRLPASLDPQINDRIMDLILEITRYRLAFPESERWFAPEEELLVILRAQNMSYKHIAKVGNYPAATETTFSCVSARLIELCG
ncbi:hypothetical protein C7999DRAFT_17867 [Corynascus novoguineensis]|uniref:Uncharacterized protein n=1 Tax=Corynascus novoguineensis TaxID=1126955 RepID=A0AAN7CKP1_9PEZI|nr:hypothetical protein C7999DRAFT_17867 [Corynascus novoguineensis]